MSLTYPTVITAPFAWNGDFTLPPTTGTNADPTVSLEVGFPLTQSTPLGSSGVPVNRDQTNGVFNLYSSFLVWINAGGYFTFQDDIVTELSGYDEGAILWCATNQTYQLSLIPSNTNNFLTNPLFINDGTNWITINNTYTVKEFTSAGSTTLTIPDGIHEIYVTLVGAGGGGGGGQTTSGATPRIGGGGGASGGVVKSWLSVTPGQVLNITVGAGGTGGAHSTSPTVGHDGNDGGGSLIVGILVAQGGKGGKGSTGTIGQGGDGYFGQTSARGGSTLNDIGGNGAASILAPGATGSIPDGSHVADSGFLGSGGAGGGSALGSPGVGGAAGGKGGDGYVKIEWGFKS